MLSASRSNNIHFPLMKHFPISLSPQLRCKSIYKSSKSSIRFIKYPSRFRKKNYSWSVIPINNFNFTYNYCFEMECGCQKYHLVASSFASVSKSHYSFIIFHAIYHWPIFLRLLDQLRIHSPFFVDGKEALTKLCLHTRFVS